MRIHITLLVVLVCCLSGCTHEKPPASADSNWSEDEIILAQAVAIRAVGLEKKSGFHFDKNWQSRVSLEWSLDSSGIKSAAGMYIAEERTIKFPISLTYELAERHDKIPVRLMDPETIAADPSFARLADHELGHAIMDQVSRRNNIGPWFTKEQFISHTEEYQLGINIVSEGTAVFFEEIEFPTNGKDGEFAFPGEAEKFAGAYTYELVAYKGGHWLVREILAKHGERGLVWMMSHPFKASHTDMRKAAMAYRERALSELGKK